MVFLKALEQVRRDSIIVGNFKMAYLKKTRQCTVNAVRRVLVEVVGGKSAVPRTDIRRLVIIL